MRYQLAAVSVGQDHIHQSRVKCTPDYQFASFRRRSRQGDVVAIELEQPKKALSSRYLILNDEDLHTSGLSRNCAPVGFDVRLSTPSAISVQAAALTSSSAKRANHDIE